jgi:hypothetical protein
MRDLKNSKLVGTSKVPSVAIPNEALGTPGARISLHIIPQFEGGHADEKALSDNTQRAFRVSANLSNSPSAIGRIKGDFGTKDGDSFLVIPPQADHFRFDTKMGQFHVKKNDAGRVSFIEMECTARDRDEAKVKFIDAVYPALDHLSYAFNVPLFVSIIRIVDVPHQIIHIDCAAPYRLQIVPNFMSRLFVQMKPVYSMYREAKNSESDFYKFLCFYKIMEGLLGKMRANAFVRAKETGVKVQMEKNLVPDDEHLPVELRPYVGKPMKAFFDNFLTGKFRNAVAHFMTDEGGILQVSSPAELDTYASLALITDLCSRQLIVSHEQLLAILENP